MGKFMEASFRPIISCATQKSVPRTSTRTSRGTYVTVYWA
jgi:hypothetical protein